ncbi:MAG TPA: hypothetical protein VFT43_05300, partial [Candidatus Polarisedimenticolia bacterium]|nr:hypothetical protein [Candidatus Polarisedimenticolia bacterium]
FAASGRRDGPLRVAPEVLEPGSFLASLTGHSLGLSLTTDLAGVVNVSVVDAGVGQTAYGMLADLLAIHQGRPIVEVE